MGHDSLEYYFFTFNLVTLEKSFMLMTLELISEYPGYKAILLAVNDQFYLQFQYLCSNF